MPLPSLSCVVFPGGLHVAMRGKCFGDDDSVFVDSHPVGCGQMVSVDVVCLRYLGRELLCSGI